MDVQLSAMGARVWLFHLKSSQGVLGSLSLNVIREISSYLKGKIPLLFQVSPDFLRSFNCQTSTWSPQVPLRTHIQVDATSVWVVLEDGRLLCCGGGHNPVASLTTPNPADWNSDYLISRKGEVSALPNMHMAWSSHGGCKC